MHPPQVFSAVIEAWTGLASETAALIARSSFGDFIFYSDQQIRFVDVHRGRIESMPEDVELLLEDILCDETFLEDFLRRSLHDAGVTRLGKPDRHACFGFVPALALGGSESVDSVQTEPLVEHLVFLARLNGPVLGT
jgi:hypothetical protein